MPAERPVVADATPLPFARPLRVGVDATAAGIAGSAPTGVVRYIRQLLQASGRLSPATRWTLLFALPHPRHRPAIRACVEALGLAAATVRRSPLPSRHLLRWRVPVDWFTGGIDVFHAPAHLGYVCRRCPQVVTVHDLAYLRDRGGDTPPAGLDGDGRRHWRTRRRFFAELAEHMAGSLAAADRIITVSQATADDLVATLGVDRARLRVVPLGLRDGLAPLPAAAQRPALDRLGLAPGYFLYVGLLDPNKNLATLVEGFAAYRRRGGRRRLVLAGPSNFHAGVLADAGRRLGLGDALHFTGFVAEADLAALYSAARALLMPSPLEGFGLPAIEAMACATPVIGADAGALPEVIGDAGLIVDHRRPEAFADALGALDEDAVLHARLAARGRQRAAGFSWQRAASQTLAIYAELVDGRAAPSPLAASGAGV